MNMEVLLAIVGAALSIIGSVNAFFIKGLMDSINSIKLDLLKTTTEHSTTIRDIGEAKVRVKSNEDEIARCKDRIHKLEGGQSQLLQFLRDNEYKL